MTRKAKCSILFSLVLIIFSCSNVQAESFNKIESKLVEYLWTFETAYNYSEDYMKDLKTELTTYSDETIKKLLSPKSRVSKAIKMDLQNKNYKKTQLILNKLYELKYINKASYDAGNKLIPYIVKENNDEIKTELRVMNAHGDYKMLSRVLQNELEVEEFYIHYKLKDNVYKASYTTYGSNDDLTPKGSLKKVPTKDYILLICDDKYLSDNEVYTLYIDYAGEKKVRHASTGEVELVDSYKVISDKDLDDAMYQNCLDRLLEHSRDKNVSNSTSYKNDFINMLTNKTICEKIDDYTCYDNNELMQANTPIEKLSWKFGENRKNIKVNLDDRENNCYFTIYNEKSKIFVKAVSYADGRVFGDFSKCVNYPNSPLDGDKYKIELGFSDVDKDGIKDIILAVYFKELALDTYVYYSNLEDYWNPEYTLEPTVLHGEHHVIITDTDFILPFESENYYEVYKYKDKKIQKIASKSIVEN